MAALSRAETVDIPVPPSPNRKDYEELRESGSMPDILMVKLEGHEAQCSDVQYTALFHEAKMAIDQDFTPELIRAGSSGSYVLKNRQSVCGKKFPFLFCYANRIPISWFRGALGMFRGNVFVAIFLGAVVQVFA